MTNPCKDCELRHAACHAECEVYKTWAAEMLKIKPKRDGATNFLIDNCRRTNRRLHKK